MGNPFKRVERKLKSINLSDEFDSFVDDPLRYGERLGNKIVDETSFGLDPRGRAMDALGLGPDDVPDLPPVPQEETPEGAAERIADYQAFIGDVARRRGVMQNQTQGFQSQVVAGQSPALTLGLGDYLGNINT